MPALRLVSSRSVASIAAAIAVVACGGKDSTAPAGTTPSSLAVVAGDNQTGVVGQGLTQPLVVKVTDRAGAALSGVTVTWLVSLGAGRVSAASTASDAQGEAQVTWTLGPAAGPSNNDVSATVTGLPSVTFTATAIAGPPTQLTMMSGNAQTGLVGEPLPEPLIVAVRDQYGNAPTSVTVSWAVTAGGGTVSAATVATDAAGEGLVTWTLGPAEGADNNSVQASAAGLAGSPTTFVATGATTVVYTDPATFQQVTAGRGTPKVVNFEDIDANPVNNTTAGRTPFDGSHYATQGFTFASPGGYPLFIVPGGLFWNSSNSLSVGHLPYQSDMASSGTNDADSLRVTLNPGCGGVAFQLVDIGVGANGHPSSADSIMFLDSNGAVVQRIPFPANYTNYRAFAGLLSTSHVVTTILVAEQALNGDDVDYDDFVCFTS